MIDQIVAETETPGDSRTLFRVRMDNLVIGQSLTAAQGPSYRWRSARPGYAAAAAKKGSRAIITGPFGERFSLKFATRTDQEPSGGRPQVGCRCYR